MLNVMRQKKKIYSGHLTKPVTHKGDNGSLSDIIHKPSTPGELRCTNTLAQDLSSFSLTMT